MIRVPSSAHARLSVQVLTKKRLRGLKGWRARHVGGHPPPCFSGHRGKQGAVARRTVAICDLSLFATCRYLRPVAICGVSSSAPRPHVNVQRGSHRAECAADEGKRGGNGPGVTSHSRRKLRFWVCLCSMLTKIRAVMRGPAFILRAFASQTRRKLDPGVPPGGGTPRCPVSWGVAGNPDLGLTGSRRLAR